MRRTFGLTLLAMVMSAPAAPVRAQSVRETLGNLPAESLAFGITNRLDQIDARLQAMAKKLDFPPISPLELAKATVGISKGLDVKGRVAMVVLPPGEEGVPTSVLFVPVSDYKEFVGQFQGKDTGISEITLPDGKRMAVAKKGKHAILTAPDHAAVLKSVLSSQESLASWAQPLEGWLDENGFSLVATPRGVKLALAAARKGLAKAKSGLGDKQEIVGPWLEGAEGFLKSIESDVSHAAVGGRIDKAGNAVLDARALFNKGSGFAKAAADINPLSGGALAGLPAGPYAMAFGGAFPPKIMDGMLKMNVEFMRLMAKEKAAELSPDNLRKFEQTMARMSKNIDGMSFLFRVGKAKDNDAMFSRVVGLLKTTDAAAYLDNYEKMLPELTKLSRDLKIPFMPENTVKKKSVGGINVFEVTTDLYANKTEEPDPVQKKMMEAMFGPGGKMKTSLAVADANTVIVTYTSAERLKEVLDDLAAGKKHLKDDPDVTKSLGLLPKGSQWVLLFNPSGLAELTSEWLKNLAPNVPIQIPELPSTPPVGVGIRLSETGGELQLVVPVQVIETFGRMLSGQLKGA